MSLSLLSHSHLLSRVITHLEKNKGFQNKESSKHQSQNSTHPRQFRQPAKCEVKTGSSRYWSSESYQVKNKNMNVTSVTILVQLNDAIQHINEHKAYQMKFFADSIRATLSINHGDEYQSMWYWSDCHIVQWCWTLYVFIHLDNTAMSPLPHWLLFKPILMNNIIYSSYISRPKINYYALLTTSLILNIPRSTKPCNLSVYV